VRKEARKMVHKKKDDVPVFALPVFEKRSFQFFSHKKGLFYIVDLVIALSLFLVGIAFILSLTYSIPSTFQLELSSSNYVDRLFTHSISNYSSHNELLRIRLTQGDFVPSEYLTLPIIDYMYFVHNQSLDTSLDPLTRERYGNISLALVNATTFGLLPRGYNAELYFDDVLVGRITQKPLDTVDAANVISYERIYIGKINNSFVHPTLVRVKVW
jgi:hypothetical protein